VAVRRWYIAVGIVALIALVWWRFRGEDDALAPATTTASGEAAPASPTAPSPPALRVQPRAARSSAPRAHAFDPSTQHSVDPCTALEEPSLPAGYDSITVRGITVAWEPDAIVGGAFDAPLRPSSLANLVAGIVEEAAQLTGTEPRTELTVIVDPTSDDYRKRTRAPAWSSGFYDGGAIRLFASTGEDLAVALPTLRHEIMHAQVHAGIGCTPWWLNEGLAQYFAGSPPMREWIALLRTGDAFDLRTLRDPAMRALAVDTVRRSYAWSFAMVAFIVERAGEPALRSAGTALHAADNERAAVELWEKLYPDIGPPQLLDFLATKLFGKPRGAELDALLAGPLCCVGFRDLRSTACRATTARTTTRPWYEGTAPRALCENRW
jgi:hypothetical protein